MNDFNSLLSGLKASPDILRSFVESIPLIEQRKLRREHFWSIHEHICHLALVQPMLYQRLTVFQKEENPVFIPYFPKEEDPQVNLMTMDVGESLDNFSDWRQKQTDLISTFDIALWHKTARHPEYKMYTPQILVRHILMHDHWHMYRMEELWLTRDEFLSELNP